MNTRDLEQQIIKHEGEKLKPYKCTAGFTTIGVGRNLDAKGITLEESRYLLRNDIHECCVDLNNLFKDFDSLPEKIQHVLIDMRFNLGAKGFRKFKKMIEAVRKSDWKETAAQMKDSNWRKQVKTRATNLIRMVEEV